jgi:hypothetical protein
LPQSPPARNGLELSPYRNWRLRPSPGKEFRDRLTASSDVNDIVVDTISGARSIDSLVAEPSE